MTVSALAAAREAARKLGIDVAAHQVTSLEEIRGHLRTVAGEHVRFVRDARGTVSEPVLPPLPPAPVVRPRARSVSGSCNPRVFAASKLCSAGGSDRRAG